MTDSRFTVVYQINAGDQTTASERATDICIEQTVEIPLDVVPEHLKKTMVGRTEELTRLSDSHFRAVISYPLSGIGTDTVQFLNMLFGNISLKLGVKITGMDWNAVSHLFSGPRFGIPGIRNLIGIPERAMSCTSIKPIGLSSKELADVCYQFSMGGLDIFKDDHSLANQDSARFDDRVKMCVDAIRSAADKTGKKSLYFPNITADGEETVKRYLKAAELGADGVLIMPQLTGITLLQNLAKLEPALPIMAHPGFAGPFVIHPDHGFTPAFYFGELWRALGADCLVYPNANGRFVFTEEQCKALNNSAKTADLPFKPSFPTPGGGIQRGNIPKWLQSYGPDTIFLVGGSLYQHPEGKEAAARDFQQILEQ